MTPSKAEMDDASDTSKNGITGTLKDTVGVKNPYRYRYDTETGLYYLESRYYNSEWGRFINADVILGQVGQLLGHNMFAYCLNNPIKNSDPKGYWVVDTIFLMADVAEFLASPTLGTAGWVLLDAVTFIDPTGAATTSAHAAKAAHIAHAAQAGELIGRYKKVKSAVKGMKLEVHHLVEKRLASVLGVKKNDMIAVALTKKEHTKYTRRWRKAIPYGTDYDSLDIQEVIDTVSNVYRDNEGLRRATLNWMRQLEKNEM